MNNPTIWVMRHSNNTPKTRWDVGYYLSVPVESGGGIVVYEPEFYTVYEKLSRGDAADKVHYLNGGEKH